LLEISEDEAEDKLQTAIQDKFSVFGEVCFNWWNKKPFQFIKRAFWEYLSSFGHCYTPVRTKVGLTNKVEQPNYWYFKRRESI